MRGNECYHIPTAPGQTMCTCEDWRMFLEALIEQQAKYIAYLEKRFQKGEVRMIFNDLG